MRTSDRRANRTPSVMLLVTFATLCMLKSPVLPARAQDVPPDQGGLITSIGQPSSLKPYGGLSGGGYFEAQASEFTAYLSAGIRKDLLSPIAALAALQLEGYGGVRGDEADGGLRGFFAIPFLRLGFGVDWNFKDGSLPFLMRFSIPFRRGGVITRAGQATIDWIPARGHSFNLGFNFPVGQRWAGKSRPNQMRYPVGPARPDFETVSYANPALESVLANVRETSNWVNRLTVPYFDHTGRRRDVAVAAFTEDMQDMAARLASDDPLFGGPHSATAELQAYHAEVVRAFSIALNGEELPLGMASPSGEEAAAVARAILLEEVLLPYDRLLGVHKKHDSTVDLAYTAMEKFTAWAESGSVVPPERLRAVRYVFRTVLDEVEAARVQSREWWGDDRLVWLPLQYGLLPEEHDTQPELDAIIERATGERFSGANRAAYAFGLQFQWELADGIERAEDYHVLWIHDYTGANAAGEPDLISFYMTRRYLRSLASRARAYDETGRMPTYFVFIDQHYYEIKNARFWMNVLERPMDHVPDMPQGFEWMADSLTMVQEDLRAAVERSERLQAAAAEYGEHWLSNRIRVHVNVTNPADLSYWANSVFPLAGWPDNAIRDHRKIAFYDITEEDPYKGSATFSGMGVGEHYVGPNWEDRALVLEGPAALEVKNQARDLLLSQGFEEDEIPEPLRPRPFGEDYEEKLAEYAHWAEGGARAMQLHNGTGYLMKPINVAKAVLYTLMPPAAVIIDPDSLFHSPLWASMLLGSSLRGVKVIIIHPSQKNAPGQAFMTLSRASELFERMIIAGRTLEAELAEVAGVFRGGLYDTDVDVANLPARAQVVADGFRSKPWLRDVLPIGPELMAVYDDVGAIFEEATGGGEIEYISDELGGIRRPMLHLKTNFFMTGETVKLLLRHPAFAEFARDFAAERSLDSFTRSEYRDVRQLSQTLSEPFLDMLRGIREEYGPEVSEQAVGYFIVGSSNQDYRSMLMDGEAAVVLAHRASLNGFFDSIGLAAESKYPESVEALNQYLPYFSDMKWKISRWIKVAL